MLRVLAASCGRFFERVLGDRAVGGMPPDLSILDPERLRGLMSDPSDLSDV